jgi:Transposase IS66 family
VGSEFSKVEVEQQRQASAWLQTHHETLPPDVAEGLARSLKFWDDISALKNRCRGQFRQLLRAMRIVKSSERDAEGDVGHSKPAERPPKGSTQRLASDIERLTQNIAHSGALEDWHRRHADGHRDKKTVWTQKLKRLMAKMAQAEDQATVGQAPNSAEASTPAPDGAEDTAPDGAEDTAPAAEQAWPLNTPEPDQMEPELSAEREAELARQSADWRERSDSGGGPDPRFAPLSEALMTGMTANLQHGEATCSVEQDIPKSAKVLKVLTEERQRVDFSFQVTVVNLSVEKAVVSTPRGKTMISASTDAFGPPKKSVTWGFLTSMSMQVALYAMPFHRLARLVSTPFKRFTSIELTRHFQGVARHLLPLYVSLGMKLADAPVLSGDDTPSKVLEVIKGLKKKADKPPPWASYATPELARQTRIHQEEARKRSLDQREKAQRGQETSVDGPPKIRPPVKMSVLLAEVFGFASERKDGTKDKVSFNTTVLVGRANPDEPKSTIVFYRSHLGSVGNLLDRILRHRRADNRSVVVQTDLSTTNLVHPDIAKTLDIKQAGCGAHARRPFRLHKKDDPNACHRILHFFKGFAIYDRRISLKGRNETNTLAVRRVEHRQMWEDIRGECQLLLQRWSKRTELGRAAAYVIKHYDKLTYYLNDARVEWTNNLCERMLRLEKLIAKSSYFRKSIEGRCALDIVRTILQTAIAADVDPNAYLQWVLRMPADAIMSEPDAFTPWAYAKWVATRTDDTADAA